MQALEQTGQRFLLVSGWFKTARTLPESFFEIESAPHDWLFPQMAAIVHHGGAGTTAATLRAGKAAVICPLVADQPFWARLMTRIGVALGPFPLRSLKTAQLIEAILRVTTEPTFAQRAAELGERIHSEQGAVQAADLIERYLHSS